MLAYVVCSYLQQKGLQMSTIWDNIDDFLGSVQNLDNVALEGLRLRQVLNVIRRDWLPASGCVSRWKFCSAVYFSTNLLTVADCLCLRLYSRVFARSYRHGRCTQYDAEAQRLEKQTCQCCKLVSNIVVVIVPSSSNGARFCCQSLATLANRSAKKVCMLAVFQWFQLVTNRSKV